MLNLATLNACAWPTPGRTNADPMRTAAIVSPCLIMQSSSLLLSLRVFLQRAAVGIAMGAMLSTCALACQTAEAQDDRPHPHAVAARRDGGAPDILVPPRELQPLPP